MPIAACGRRPTDLRQLTGWWLSSVWHNDDVVFKATHPSWPSEPTVNELLHRVVPQHVERVVASGFVSKTGHAPTPWMVQLRARTGAIEPPEDAELAREERRRLTVACVEALARIQLALVDRDAELRAAGVEDRSTGATRAGLAGLWAAPELESLERLGVTPLLAHGDLHLGNVVRTASGELKLIDWTDAALSWPGVDLLTLLPRRSDPEACESIIAAYELALGDRFGPFVRPGLDLADVFHAISYAKIDAFLPVSARWELGGTVRSLVKRQLERVMR
jgi:hypothetical protein